MTSTQASFKNVNSSQNVQYRSHTLSSLFSSSLSTNFEMISNNITKKSHQSRNCLRCKRNSRTDIPELDRRTGCSICIAINSVSLYSLSASKVKRSKNLDPSSSKITRVRSLIFRFMQTSCWRGWHSLNTWHSDSSFHLDPFFGKLKNFEKIWRRVQSGWPLVRTNTHFICNEHRTHNIRESTYTKE